VLRVLTVTDVRKRLLFMLIIICVSRARLTWARAPNAKPLRRTGAPQTLAATLVARMKTMTMTEWMQTRW
jgi:hypothetical protein